MIKITNGTFGFRTGKVVVPLTKDSGAVELPKELEKRLVEVDKIAEYVEAPKAVKEEKPQYDRAFLMQRYKELELPGNPVQIKNEVLAEAIAKAEEEANAGSDQGQTENTEVDGEGDGQTQPEGGDNTEITEVGETNPENLIPDGKEQTSQDGNGAVVDNGQDDNNTNDAPNLTGDDGIVE